MARGVVRPKVSVVIPAYNAEKTIARTVGSVLRQSLRSLEVIVVDDASTDGTAAVVGAISDPRLRLYRSRKNLGVSGARNYGAKRARADLLAFLDADDLYLPGFLASARALRDPLYDAVQTGFLLRHPIDRRWYEKLRDWLPITKIVRRRVFKAIGGYCEEGMLARGGNGEDLLFSELLHTYFNVKALDKKLVEYVRFPGNHVDIHLKQRDRPVRLSRSRLRREARGMREIEQGRMRFKQTVRDLLLR